MINHFSFLLSLLESVLLKPEVDQNISIFDNTWKSFALRVSSVVKEAGIYLSIVSQPFIADSSPKPSAQVIAIVHKLLQLLRDIVTSKLVTDHERLRNIFQVLLESLVTPLSSSFFHLSLDEKLEQNELEKNIFPPIGNSYRVTNYSSERNSCVA